MSSGDLLFEIRDRAAWITINREARRNALSMEMIDLFTQYLAKADSDPEVRVVCLTAVGDKAFCSGADLAGGDPLEGAKKYAGLLKKMAAFSKPIIARVGGHCMAGGMGLMLACDVVYAPCRVKFGTPEVKVGLFPMMVTALVMRNAVRKKAMEMIFTGNSFTARAAEEMGLITRACADEEFEATVANALKTIASRAPLAVSMGKQAVAAVEGKSLEASLDYLCDQLAKLARTEDAVEGITAFVEKRDPVWKGQ